MPITLHSLIQQVAVARNEWELRLQFMDAAGELFGAKHWSIYLGDGKARPKSVDIKGLPDSFIDYYEKFGLAIDPFLHYVLEHHAPVHEQLLFTEAGWKQSALYQDGCGQKYDHEHVLTGPIVGQGQLIGTVYFARTSGTPAFGTRELANLSALCAHLSASLAVLQTQPHCLNAEWVKQLTPRELQIAELVTKGLTNTEIGSELWITHNTVKQALRRIFRKLNVSTRAQMVAQLLPKVPFSQ